MKEIPLFVLNGFLDSGKTTIIKEIIENNPNYQDNSTVIIACEQGEVEYDEEWLEKYSVHIEYIENQEDFSPNFLANLDKIYKADQYVIEYNSFFDWEKQEFPRQFVIYQQITLIDASTFGVMFNNMRKVFQQMVKDSSLVIFNRCDGVKDLGQFRRYIRTMNQNTQVAFEDASGKLTTMLEEDLPYDLKQDEIAFEEDVYPTWYIDVFDNHEKYLNKVFKFKTYVRDIYEKTFVAGRQVMTCCANDIQFLGYEVVNDTDTKVNVDDAIYLECTVNFEYSDKAKEDVVILHAKKITILAKDEEQVLTM